MARNHSHFETDRVRHKRAKRGLALHKGPDYPALPTSQAVISHPPPGHKPHIPGAQLGSGVCRCESPPMREIVNLACFPAWIWCRKTSPNEDISLGQTSYTLSLTGTCLLHFCASWMLVCRTLLLFVNQRTCMRLQKSEV